MKLLAVDTFSSYLSLSPHRVKFLLSVADDYEFICPAPVIYYDPVTYLPTFCIDRLHLEYRADFLIRHRGAGEALLVDLFPSSMADDARLFLRRRVAERYIAWKGYDWQYRCLFQEYVLLSESESLLFDTYLLMQTEDDRRLWLRDYLLMVDAIKPAIFQSSSFSLLDFLIHGVISFNR